MNNSPLHAAERRCFQALLVLFLAAPAARATDCNGNVREDRLDVTSGSSADCNLNLIPDECDIRQVNYGLALHADIAAFEHGDVAGRLSAFDLDGDGAPDLAASFLSRATVSVLWNDGTGRLARGEAIHVATHPFRVTGGDLDVDGDIDLAVACGQAVSVLRNDGQRRFTREEDAPLDFPVSEVALAEFDGKAGLELAAVGAFTLAVLRRAAPGVYGKVVDLTIGSGPVSVLARDLDGDADLDLATGNSRSNVSILLNAGGGGFAAARNYFAGEPLISLAAGDLDGDVDLELIALLTRGVASPDEVSVLFNSGAGAFAEHAAYPSLFDGSTLMAEDFDRDGDLDLGHAGAHLSFLPNHGERRLGPALAIPFAVPASSAVAADLDRDGIRELAVVQANTNGFLSIYKESRVSYRPDCNRDAVPDDCQLVGNDCNGNGIPDGCDVALASSKDCDADGTPDECELDCNRNEVPDDCDLADKTSADCNANRVPDECDLEPLVRFLGPRNVAREIGLGVPHAADIDQDGDQDLVALTGETITFLNDGSGTFDKGREQPLQRGAMIRLLADLDGDGDPDLLVDSGKVETAFLNDGQGAFAAGPAFEGPEPVSWLAADLLGDGGVEIALGARSGEVTLHRLEGSAFQHVDGFPAGGELRALASGDFDVDGDLDLTAFLGATIRVFLNDAGSGFPLAKDSAAGGANSRFTVADLDGDGARDLVESGLPGMRVLRNRGDGSFERGESRHFDWPSTAITAADLDGDGDSDLVVWGHAIVLVNDGAGGLDSSFPVSNLHTFGGWIVARAAELDGDGLLDLVTLSDGGCIGPLCFDDEISIRLNRTVRAASDDANRNRLPDECEGRPFRRGDFGDDGRVDLTDALALLAHLFHGGPTASCSAAADADGDARIDIADPVFLCRWLFAGGPEPPAPSPTLGCGHEPDPPGWPGRLSCESYDGC